MLVFISILCFSGTTSSYFEVPDWHSRMGFCSEQNIGDHLDNWITKKTVKELILELFHVSAAILLLKQASQLKYQHTSACIC